LKSARWHAEQRLELFTDARVVVAADVLLRVVVHPHRQLVRQVTDVQLYLVLQLLFRVLLAEHLEAQVDVLL
jgi:hypothetical protein